MTTRLETPWDVSISQTSINFHKPDFGTWGFEDVRLLDDFPTFLFTFPNSVGLGVSAQIKVQCSLQCKFRAGSGRFWRFRCMSYVGSGVVVIPEVGVVVLEIPVWIPVWVPVGSAMVLKILVQVPGWFERFRRGGVGGSGVGSGTGRPLSVSETWSMDSPWPEPWQVGGAAWAATEAAGETPSHLPQTTLEGCETSDAWWNHWGPQKLRDLTWLNHTYHLSIFIIYHHIPIHQKIVISFFFWTTFGISSKESGIKTKNIWGILTPNNRGFTNQKMRGCRWVCLNHQTKGLSNGDGSGMWVNLGVWCSNFYLACMGRCTESK